MHYDLVKLYHYIFGDWADIEKHIGKDLPPAIKRTKIKRKKAEICKFFAEIKKDFTHLIPDNSPLLNILSLTKTSNPWNYEELPEEKLITAKLHQLEKKYRLLQDEKGQLTPENISLFNQCCKVSKAISFIFERGEGNNDEVFLHAYKILVLFGKNPKKCLPSLQKYLEKFNFFNLSLRPLHDALIFELPSIRGQKIDLNQWRKLINDSGVKILKLFNLAPEIEKHLHGKCPADLKQANAIVQKFNFKRSEEHPELAQLFLDFNLNEKLFNETLDVDKHRKRQDKLPDIRINGAEMNPSYTGYYFAKLSIDDPRAYVLGHITNCCQSMGGHSQQCVIDGVTLENNGFYVLLKEKKKSPKRLETKEFTPTIFEIDKQGKKRINYDLVDIVGQGYAWLSKNRNLVFDSWENLNPLHDDKIIVELLKSFSQQATEEEISSICRINIGTGGKTPVCYRSHKAKFAERMQEGKQYADSREQALIYLNEERRRKVITKLSSKLSIHLSTLEKMDASISLKINPLLEWISEGCVMDEDFQESVRLLTLDNLKLLFTLTDCFDKTSWMNLVELNKTSSFTKENIIFLLTKRIPDKVRDLISTFIGNGFTIDESIRNSFAARIYDHMECKSINDILSALTLLRKEKLDNDLIVRLTVLKCTCSEDAARAISLKLLEKPPFKNEEDRNTWILNIVLRPEKAEAAAKAFSLLKQENLQDHFSIVLEHAKPYRASLAIISLHKANINIESIKTEILNANWPDEAVKAFIHLKEYSLQDNAPLREEIFKTYDPVKCARAYVKLRVAKLEDDLILRKRVFESFDPLKTAEILISAFAILREAKLDAEQSIKTIIINSIYPESEALELKTIVISDSNPSERTKKIATEYEEKITQQLPTKLLEELQIRNSINPLLFKKIELFIDHLQKMVESMPEKTMGIFPSVNLATKKKCLADLGQFCHSGTIYKSDASKYLLLIIVQFHSQLVGSKSKRYLTALRSFLEDYHLIIPDLLKINAEHKPIPESFFNNTLEQFNKSLKDIILPTKTFRS